ncbi:GlxA family transcriptional regulator [Streptosporangium sp. NPDC050855]|uniref:GlxA family transcriptional regulator n=1 Tax=Streptosporangium sp. NPDC050855 TaxID=3366194 RepID=UPI0037BDAA9B
MSATVQKSRPGVVRCRAETSRGVPGRSRTTPAGPFRSVAAFATQGVSSLGLSVAGMVFADRSHLGLPRFTYTVCSDGGEDLLTDLSLHMEVEHGLEALSGADLIIVLPTEGRPLTLRRSVVDALNDAHRRGAIIAAYSTGTFLLAETGLLDGRRAVTDRRLADRLAKSRPGVVVDPEALYADEGSVVTGAGAAVGIDVFLHLLHREHGVAVSDAVAREAMAAPRRESGQVRYAPTPADGTGVRAVPGGAPLAEVLLWARSRLQQPMSIGDLAGHALMSPRTFARRFREATGTTPYAWLREQRLDRAEELLKTTDLPIRTIAEQAGFRSESLFRGHFTRRHGVPPRDYRRAFGHTP